MRHPLVEMNHERPVHDDNQLPVRPLMTSSSIDISPLPNSSCILLADGTNLRERFAELLGIPRQPRGDNSFALACLVKVKQFQRRVISEHSCHFYIVTSVRAGFAKSVTTFAQGIKPVFIRDDVDFWNNLFDCWDQIRPRLAMGIDQLEDVLASDIRLPRVKPKLDQTICQDINRDPVNILSVIVEVTKL